MTHFMRSSSARWLGVRFFFSVFCVFFLACPAYSSVRLVGGLRDRDGISSKTFRVLNRGDEVVGSILLVVRSSPMSFFGFSRDSLSIYPSGTGLLYIHDPSGPLLLPRQERDFTVFFKGGGAIGAEALVTNEDIARRLVLESDTEELFSDYSPQIKEALLGIFSAKDSMSGILGAVGGEKIDGGGVGMHAGTILNEAFLRAGGTLGDSINMGKRIGGGDAAGQGMQLFYEAGRAYEQHDLGRAEGLLRASLLAYPKNGRALNNLGYVMLIRGGDLEAASYYAEKALEKDPGNPHFLSTLSDILWEKGDRAGAVATAGRAVGLDPKHSRIGRKGGDADSGTEGGDGN